MASGSRTDGDRFTVQRRGLSGRSRSFLPGTPTCLISLVKAIRARVRNLSTPWRTPGPNHFFSYSRPKCKPFAKRVEGMLECSDRRAYQCASIKRFARGGGPGCALLAGSITSIKPGAFQIGTREDRAQRPCRSPAALQGLSGIGIPNRKTPARRIGRLCSIRGKSGGGRTGDEP